MTWHWKLFVIALCGSECFASTPGAVASGITPNVVLFSTSNGNVVCSVGPDGALLIGTPSVASTEAINEDLRKRTNSALRYVVIWPQDLEHSQGDAGWRKHGAFVAMQEKALERLGGHGMGAPKPQPSQLLALGAARPPVAFSEVLTFDMNGDSIHVVHQAPGYSDADAIAHFHVANLIYLGEVFPGDGYPAIDTSQAGTLDGLLRTLAAWTSSQFRIVPARGKVTTGATVKQFHDAVTAVRGRVQEMIQAGKTEPEIIAAHPTSNFDAEWGHGRVTPDVFVHELYVSLTSRPAPASHSNPGH
jgi:cyclase